MIILIIGGGDNNNWLKLFKPVKEKSFFQKCESVSIQ